ncbi:MAG: nucleotidyltransferase, partial [Muribaculaceae bacterium]|nr:nucleotidyltransferase [Muribaculaceae bacterium]
MEPDSSIHVISVKASVRQALRALNDLSGETMTLFALDSRDVLCGTVTDGDIRRALIAGASLDDTLEQVMHRDFRALRPGDDAFILLPRLRKQGIILVPVLDEKGCIKDIIDLRTARTRLPVDAVLMAG